MRVCVFLNSPKRNRLNFFQRASLRKRHAEKPNSLLHTHGILRRLDLLTKSAARCLNKRINSNLNPHPNSANDSSTLRAQADDSAVTSLTLGLTMEILP
jgi:hypothetical protein